jgi:hypothetical protein
MTVTMIPHFSIEAKDVVAKLLMVSAWTGLRGHAISKYNAADPQHLRPVTRPRQLEGFLHLSACKGCQK